MNVFLARQPIFDMHQKVYAYEILYRSGLANVFDGTEPDQASANVVINAFQSFNIEHLTNHKPLFINFTANFIHEEIATLFPKELLVIELLENIYPYNSIIEKCRNLKAQGYTIALDDFIYQPGYEPLIDLADIIKVDFLNATQIQIEEVLAAAENRKITLLAEKVETQEDFARAQKMGFTLFQGYFFSKPEVLTTKGLAPLKTNALQLMQKVNEGHLNFEEIAQMVSQDLSLTYNLLKLINSAAFGFRSKIDSVKQALVLLGEREIKKWITLIALNGLGQDKPDEVVRLSLIRAKFAELISGKTRFHQMKEDFFLAGLFSLLDVILNKPLEAALDDISTTDGVKDCLLGRDFYTSQVCYIITRYEKGQWDRVMIHADLLDIPYQEVINAYLDALSWYNQVAA